MARKRKAKVMTAGEIIRQLRRVPANDVPIFVNSNGHYAALKSLEIGRTNTWQEQTNGDIIFRDPEGKHLFTVEAE